MLFSLLAALQIGPAAFLAQLNGAVQSSAPDQVRAVFAYPDTDAKYVLAMAGRRGGLNKLRVAMIPVPPGWTGRGSYWAIFHTFQDIEEDHDPVYEVLSTGDGYKLGREVREDDLNGWRIASESYTARLTPEDHTVQVQATVNLTKGLADRAPVFRLNDVYVVVDDKAKIVQANTTTIPDPTPDSVVRAGSLLIPWTTHPKLSYKFGYFGVLNRDHEDKIDETAAYVTAWWLPSLGRLPFTVKGSIDAPKDWIVRGEGVQTARDESGDRATTQFACDLPISFPKVIGGKYKLVLEKKDGGQDFKIFQLEPIEEDRAKDDLIHMMEAAKFFQERFGPLPFPGYECYDADSYYGVESYSHTLLGRKVTHFISHEMAHSFFGGLAPCPYVHDSWDEGVAEYVDSVLLLGNRDHSLESALGTLDERTPLSAMPEAHAYQGASYWRGCYVMKMLEFEIGSDKVLGALRLLARDRKGQDTRWSDLRQYFERTSGTSLKWFWEQWIDGGTFPTLKIAEISPIQNDKRYHTIVTVTQSGVPQPYRIKFALEFTIKGIKTRKMCDLDRGTDDFTFDSDSEPDDVKLIVFPYTLARTAPSPAKVRTTGTGDTH